MTEPGEDIIDCMARLKGDGQPFALATVVRTEDATAAKAGAKVLVRADGSLVGWIGGGCTLGAVKKTAARALADGRARLIRIRPDAAAEGKASEEQDIEQHRNACPSGGTVEVFVEPILPRPALIVLGASPVARALVALGARSGFAVTAAALAEDQVSLPEAEFRIEGFDLSGATQAGAASIVVATQGKRDREALAAALTCDAPYRAFVGSRKKAVSLKAAMREQDLPTDRIDALRAPAGLDVGAVTPEEIALSILTEIVQQRRHGAESAEALGPGDSVEAIDGGSFETRTVSPSLGACQGDGGKH